MCRLAGTSGHWVPRGRGAEHIPRRWPVGGRLRPRDDGAERPALPVYGLAGQGRLGQRALLPRVNPSGPHAPGISSDQDAPARERLAQGLDRRLRGQELLGLVRRAQLKAAVSEPAG